MPIVKILNQCASTTQPRDRIMRTFDKRLGWQPLTKVKVFKGGMGGKVFGRISKFFFLSVKGVVNF